MNQLCHAAQSVAPCEHTHKPMRELPVYCAPPVGNFIHRTIHSQPTGIYTSSRQSSQQVRVVLGHTLFRVAQLLDPLARVYHGRVVTAAKRITDLWKAVTRQLLGKGHGHLARARYGAAAAL